jgi:LPS sulfotransferase NodH
MIVTDALRARVAPEHAWPIAAALGPLDHGPRLTGFAPRMLLLCFTNRCGSNFLAALLAATGAFNEAGEYFNASTVLEHAINLPDPSQLPSLLNAGSWLAAKASADQLIMLADAGILDELAEHARYILLERRDKLAQAISRCIAAQNGRWTTRHPGHRADDQLVYDRAAIDAELARIALGNAGLYGFLAANEIAPLHLAYEDVVAAPAACIARIGSYLGMDGLTHDPARVLIARQANEVNAAWRRRYEVGL